MLGRRLVSQRLDADFARRTQLLPAVSIFRRQPEGRIWCDAMARAGYRRELRSTTVDFPALQAWHIPNALISGQFYVHDPRNLYCDSSIHVASASAETAHSACERLAAQFERLGMGPLVEDHSADRALVLHNEGGGTWGHYLVQIFPKVLLFLRHFPDGRVVVPAHHAFGASGFSQLFDLYGVARDRLIAAEEGKTYRIGEVVLLDFPFSFQDVAVHPAVLELLDQLSPSPPDQAPGRGIRVERLERFGRGIINEAAVAEIFAEAGMASARLGDAAVTDQAAAWRGHELVVGTLGSDLTNMVFARPGSRVLVLSPDTFGDAFFYHLAAARGIGWYEIRCGGMGPPHDPARHTPFAVDSDLLRSVLQTLS